MRYKYGLSDAEHKRLVDRFDGKCWLCRVADGQYVDHCHDSGRVRAFLCPGCNTALGQIERLERLGLTSRAWQIIGNLDDSIGENI